MVNSMSFKMTLVQHSKGRKRKLDMEAVQEVAFSAEYIQNAALRATISKARRTMDGESEILPVEGMIVVLGTANDFSDSTKGDGSRLTAEEVAAVTTVLASNPAAGKPGAAFGSGFEPKRAVKAGDTWELDARSAMGTVMEETGVDWQASKGRCTLTSQEERDGCLYGTLDFTMDLQVTERHGFQFETPLNFAVVGRLSGCLDASKPDAEFHLEVIGKGRRNVSGPNSSEALDTEIESRMTYDSSLNLIK